MGCTSLLVRISHGAGQHVHSHSSFTPWHRKNVRYFPTLTTPSSRIDWRQKMRHVTRETATNRDHDITVGFKFSGFCFLHAEEAEWQSTITFFTTPQSCNCVFPLFHCMYHVMCMWEDWWTAFDLIAGSKTSSLRAVCTDLHYDNRFFLAVAASASSVRAPRK